MSGNSETQSVLSMSDADFLNAPMPSFETASSIEQQEEAEEPEVEVEEQEEAQEEAQEAPESIPDAGTTEGTGDGVESNTEAPEKPEEDVQVPDAEAQLKKLLAPFKANGKDIKVDSVDEAIKLMQQGANYNKKMAGLKPSMKILKMLENNGLLDEGKLTYLIDLDKKNPDAISKLLKDSGIDPLDVNTREEPKYTPGNYSVSDAQVNLDSVLDSIEHTPTYTRTMTVILDEWDENSKRALANEPSLIPLINEHMSNGVFDQVAQEMMKQRALGNLSGLSDLQAYEQVGKSLAAKGAFGRPNQPAEVRTKVPVQEDTERAAKRKAASPTKQTTGAKEKEFNPLAMSDEEFEKAFQSKFR